MSILERPPLKQVGRSVPRLIESIRVMEKNGLRFVGEDKDQGLVRYCRLRQ